MTFTLGTRKSGGECADSSRRSLTKAEVQTLREVGSGVAVAKGLECDGFSIALGGLKARDVIARGNAPGLNDKIRKP